MHRLFLHNGEIRSTSDLCLAAGQVGLLSGWGVFSTLRVCDGVLFAWERHWERMKHDALRMRVPFPTSSDETEKDLLRLIGANQAWNATLRIAVVRNWGGTWEGPKTEDAFDLIAFTTDLYHWPEKIRLSLVPNARHAASEFAGTKYLSWAENLTRYERAQEQGFDEVILLNERGEICECTSANIFIAKDEHVWTPPLNSGCLPGVTRAIFLEEIRLPGLEISEKRLFPADLESADGVFITSTTRALLPVREIAGLNVHMRGEHCALLQKDFSAYVNDYVKSRRQPVITK